MLPRPQGFNEASNNQTSRVFTGTDGFSLHAISAIAYFEHQKRWGRVLKPVPLIDISWETANPS